MLLELIVSTILLSFQQPPDEFVDPITNMLMSDPVILTTSNNVVDKSTICRHLLRYVLDLENSLKFMCAVVEGFQLKVAWDSEVILLK